MAARLRDPRVLLVALSVVSLAVRLAWLSEPCRRPCTVATDHILIFDERYYVNAARVIAGIHPPHGAEYGGAPLGSDPNAEHPQLVKLIIAGAIELVGDGPFAWRIGSVLFGSLALLGMFALVRAAGGGRWVALAASGLFAADNLLIVHGRIGTLDIYVLALMIWGATLYLRGRPLAAGVLIGVGACMKFVAPYLLISLALIELLRTRRWWRFAGCVVVAAATTIVLLGVLDQIAPPYDAAAGRAVGGGPFGHLWHMISYARAQTGSRGAGGITSYPWEWLVGFKPIVYLNINPAQPVAGLRNIHPAVHFLGMISPPIMLLALPSLALAAAGLLPALRARWPRLTPQPGSVALVGLCWFLGTFAPFALFSLILNRTSYLYYMVIVMPGIYLGVVELIRRSGAGRKTIAVWVLMLLVAAALMYPLTPLP